MLFQLHKKMVGEVTYMLEEFTDPEKVQDRMKKLGEQSQHPTPYFSTRSFIDLNTQKPEPVKSVPDYFPNSSYVPNSYDKGYAGDGSWNTPYSESPIENSTGWCFGEPYGSRSEPIPCDTEDDEDVVNQYRTRHYGVGDVQTNPIFNDSDMENQTQNHFERGESSGVKKEKSGPFDLNTSEFRGNISEGEEDYPTGDVYSSLNSYVGMTDFCLGTSSDSDYTPTERQYVPDFVRKTTRYTGWRPRMYPENNDE
jgi:hypothetical protein